VAGTGQVTAGGLTPQQLAALQQAGIAAGSAAPGQNAQSFLGGAFDTSLANSGLFTPGELAAVGSNWNYGAGGTWNGSVPQGTEQAWDQEAQAALSGAIANQSSIAGLAPSSSLPAQQAIAPTSAGGQGYNPLQPGYLPTPATLNATTVNPSYLNQGLLNSLGPQQTETALQNSVAPQYQQQDQQMMQMLATAGLAPSSTAGQTAFNNLAQQQLAGISPAMASAIQNSQSNQLGAGEYNATTGNTASQYNAGSLNTAASQNLQNQLAQQSYNTGAYNTAGNTYFNALTGAYNNNANAFNALNNAGLSGAEGLASGQQTSGTTLANTAQTQYPVYSNPYSGVSAASFGSAGSYPQPTTTNNYYGTNTQAQQDPSQTGFGVGLERGDS